MKRKKEVKKINSNSNKKYIKDGKKRKERKASKINRKLEKGRKRIERMQNNKKE